MKRLVRQHAMIGRVLEFDESVAMIRAVGTAEVRALRRAPTCDPTTSTSSPTAAGAWRATPASASPSEAAWPCPTVRCAGPAATLPEYQSARRGRRGPARAPRRGPRHRARRAGRRAHGPAPRDPRGLRRAGPPALRARRESRRDRPERARHDRQRLPRRGRGHPREPRHRTVPRATRRPDRPARDRPGRTGRVRPRGARSAAPRGGAAALARPARSALAALLIAIAAAALAPIPAAAAGRTRRGGGALRARTPAARRRPRRRPRPRCAALRSVVPARSPWSRIRYVVETGRRPGRG